MIETFKNNKKDLSRGNGTKINNNSIEYIRGHQHKLLKNVRYDIRKYYFTERIVNMWNSLPDAVVN